MTCRYDIFPDLNVARIIYAGYPKARDVVELIDALERDPKYHRTVDEIIHLSCIKWPKVDLAVVDNLCELIGGLFRMNNRCKRIAVVASQEPGRLIAARFLRVMERNSRLRAAYFTQTHPAMRFLGVCDGRLLEHAAPTPRLV
ncbi:hypothetical protein [Seohaeicola zhoushanensis]|uniref:Uncharacterized protein n=1 Tax=Seohaeicola zhoushanensis TaxID=1569283 RepID=A0A8J3GU57_9RHOB|nr:hypothetical protein [Seohaeicola zhoushanensis]GHF37902.1 hypothetical protein GCM10017056_07320 [Seohaeicola zhoushanensis]